MFGRVEAAMATQVFGVSVQGASHKRIGKECQDSCKHVSLALDGTHVPPASDGDNGVASVVDDISILSVADGHGSDSCPYSKDGSEIAVDVFCKTMSDYYAHYAHDIETLLTFLNREGDTKVAQAIDQEWKRRVFETHVECGREQYLDDNGERNDTDIYSRYHEPQDLQKKSVLERNSLAVCSLYGSTLLGLMLLPSFLFAFQLGDGDMAYISDAGVEPLIVTEKILGTETHSLSKVDAWKKAVTVTKRTNADTAVTCAFMLTTDGFANSYASEEEYVKSVGEYYSLLKEHGSEAVSDNLEQWLSETSEMGCGDDITALIAYEEQI
jgi:serine/threonine protein phosphatase PrpC